MDVNPIFSLLVGALGASLVGLIGAWIQGRREHKKWLRARRFESYRDFMVDMNTAQQLVLLKQSPNDLAQRILEYTKKAAHAFESVSLLGPRRVNSAGQAWLVALKNLSKRRDDDSASNAFNDARWRFLFEAGRVLKSRNVSEERPSRSTSDEPRL